MVEEKQEVELDQEEEGDDDDDEEYGKVDYTELLIKACSNGNYDLAKKCIEKKQININKEDSKKHWTPIVWASCKGHIDIVRLLIQKGACEPYLQDSLQIQVKMGHINDQIRPSPLHWAAFKCHADIVQLLLQQNLKWDEIDAVGNNAIHQAASGGDEKIIKIFLAWGVTINEKNSRGHNIMELTTNPEIIKLIQQHENTTKCSNQKCNLKFFTQQQIANNIGEYYSKHFCEQCNKIYCQKCFQIEWHFITYNSNFKEKMKGKCNDCWHLIKSYEEKLKEKMEQNQQIPLSQILQEIEKRNIDVEVQIQHNAECLLEKLRTQNAIKEYVAKQQHVPNYKTILKSIHVISSMFDDATNRKIELEQEVKEFINNQSERLKVERDIRFELDNIIPSEAKQENVNKLQELFDRSVQRGVALEYLDVAKELLDKMNKNLEAKDILEKFKEYPDRDWYPPIFVYFDQKTKKPMDPATRKPVDPQILIPPKKKKGKGANKFIIPEWANEIRYHQEKIARLEFLIKQSEELQLGQNFVNKSPDILAKMKKEVKYRKILEEEAKIIAEKKAQEKKKKK